MPDPFSPRRDILTPMNEDIDQITTPYYVVRAASVSELIIKVNRLIQTGWELRGGVSAVVYGTPVFLQAVTQPAIHK